MTSIVITSYRRPTLLRNTLRSMMKHQGRKEPCDVVVVEDGWDGGETERVVKEAGARYFVRRDRPEDSYNPSVALNIGIRAAKGDVLIIQNAECRHSNGLVTALEKVAPGEAWFASVMALHADGTNLGWYSHPKHRPVPWFFCGAIRRENMLEFDERFTGSGYDDVDMARRLKLAGVKFRWLPPVEALAYHQWHEPFVGNSSMNAVYEEKWRGQPEG